MVRFIAGWGLVWLLAETACAGPIGTYYLTDLSNNTTGLSTLDAIRGNAYVQNPALYQEQEGPIAILGEDIRTTGYYVGYRGGEYIPAPSLFVYEEPPGQDPSGEPGHWINGILPMGVSGYAYDGTTDGFANYTVDFFTGAVIATDTFWGGDPQILFSTGGSGNLGITFDYNNHSLWIQNFYDGSITDYNLDGTVITTILTAGPNTFGYTALAMDLDHTLWFEAYGSGLLYHYGVDGGFLDTQLYVGLGLALGGEIAIPTPAGLTQWSIGLALGALGLICRRVSAHR
ncbi:MAG: hypothetical protein JSS02_05320 [Planctomycetes bacterium]|nr:hypothetical protein [Planctomycetota bacterium]